MEKHSLYDSISELWQAENYIESSMKQDVDIMPDLILLLLRGASAKIEYFSDKYGFEIDDDDLFYVEDLMDFIRKKEAVSAKGKAGEEASS